MFWDSSALVPLLVAEERSETTGAHAPSLPDQATASRSSRVEETAEVLAISPQSVTRDWKLARAWLTRELRNPRDEPS